MYSSVKKKRGADRPFGIRDKLGYLFGDFGNDFTFILSSSFLLKFYTDVMGVEAYVVGIVMMIARFADAVTDITMGRLCDKMHPTSAGKFKPWILRMCAPVAIASFLIYQSTLADAAMGFKIVWLSVTYILWGSVFYTSINIPYGSMASAISEDPHDRQSLSTFRTMGGTLAGVIIGGGIPLIVYKKVILGTNTVTILDGGRFTVVAGILSLLAIGAYLLCYFLTTERVKFDTQSKSAQSRGVVDLIKSAVTNRALISIIFASVFMLLSQLTMQGMANYIYPNYYNNATAMSVATLGMMGGMLISAAVAKPLARFLGKAEISAISNGFAAVVCFAIFLLRPQSVWVYIALQFLAWLGLGLFSMVSWALITDVIDYSEIKNGVREDGSIYAIYSFARKLGQAAASGLGGALLTIVGYSEASAFDRSVLEGVFNISTLLPAIGFAALAAILAFWYPLKKGVVNRNVAFLKAKREREI